MKASHRQRKYRLSRNAQRRCERLEARLLLDGAGGATAAAYGQLPLSFEINQGQTASQVDFLARGSGYGLFLTPSEAVLNLQAPGSQTASTPGATGTATAAASTTGDVLAMQFVGANPSAQATGVDKLQGVSNYLIGNDPSKWHTGVANYGQVEYQNLYAGIALTYYGNQRQLEYDFTVAPGADPSQIAFTVAGATDVSLDAQGNLVLHTSGGDVVEHAPVVYQQTAAGRQAIEGNYALAADGRVSFAIGAYDHSQALVIDPILSYSTYLGGSGDDQANAIAVDASGDAYVAGLTSSTDFPTTWGAYQRSLSGGADVFVAKLNPSGTGLLYATYLGGTTVPVGGSPDASTQATAIAIDASGEAYVTGSTQAVDFPTTRGALQTLKFNPNSFGQTGFVTKIDAAGNGLVYSSYLGGENYDGPSAIAIDAAGNAYVAGTTASNSFPVTSSAMQKQLAGSQNAFVSELNATGTQLVYSTYLGGNRSDKVNAIAVRASTFRRPDSLVLINTVDIYVAGFTTSSNFPTTNGALQTTFNRSQDAFVAELNPLAGGPNQLVYSTLLGGSSVGFSNGIAVDSAGDAFVVGATHSTDFPTKNAYQTEFSGNEDAFVSEINPAGAALVYSTLLGGSSDTIADKIAVDALGEAYVAGQTESIDFPTTPDAPQTYIPVPTNCAFVTKFNAAGNALVYSTYLGGGGGSGIFQAALAIALDPLGEAYVAGYTNSLVFPTTPGAAQTSYLGNGSGTGFVAKLATTALPLTVGPLTATEGASFTGVVGFFVDEAPGYSSGEGGSNSNYTPLIAWGDGNTSTGTIVSYKDGFQILGTHTYGEDGSYSLAVSVIDVDGDSATASGEATVADGLLWGVSKTATFTEGVALARTVAAFEDTDPHGAVGDYSATIDWGDGQSSPGTIVADGALLDVTGLHQYARDGSFQITIDAQDFGVDGPGGSIEIISTAAVADSLAAKSTNLSVIGNKSFTGQVATFTDPDNSVPGTADYTATITWDDGTSSPGAVSVQLVGASATFYVIGTHQFASFAGYHTISVAITDLDDGGVTTLIDSVLDPSGMTPNQIYVINAYQSAFGTAGTTDTVVAGNTLAGWAAKLDAGGTPASFTTALLHSGDYYGFLVGGLYQKYLGRGADAAGLAYWVGQLQQGMTDERIEAAFAGANEFYQHAGGTDAGWVSAMYVDILGRAADANGMAHWTAQLAQGANHAAVAQAFAASVERETQRINDDYFTDLGRAADAAGQAYWVNAFENGMHNEDVVAGFFASQEYYQAHSS